MSLMRNNFINFLVRCDGMTKSNHGLNNNHITLLSQIVITCSCHKSSTKYEGDDNK
jgi:hypothetical protein